MYIASKIIVNFLNVVVATYYLFVIYAVRIHILMNML